MDYKYLFSVFYLLFICQITNAQPFRFIVAKDGSGTHTSIQKAINDCPDNERSLIFVKNGTYEEKVSIGTRTSKSLRKISLIGESVNDVIITSPDAIGNGATNVYGCNNLCYLC